MDYNLIKELSKKKGFTLKEICQRVGMSEAGLYRAFTNNTLKVDVLEKIADVLGVSPCFFFGREEKQEQSAKLRYLKEEILDKTSISFNLHNHLDKLLREGVSISEDFLKMLNENFSTKEQKEILDAHGDSKPKFEDFRTGYNVWLLTALRNAVLGKQIPTLTTAYLAEIASNFMQLSQLAIKDKSLTFLRSEGLISGQEFLSTIANHFHLTMELEIGMPFIKYLEGHFDKDDIEVSLGRFIQKKQ